MKPKLSIIIPVYNESKNINSVLTSLQKHIHAPFELLLIYDQDSDNTIPTAQEINTKLNLPLQCIKNKYDRGALNALKTGFESAKAEAILVTMADCCDDLSDVKKGLELFNNGADLVSFSRYMKDGKLIGAPFLKGLFGKMGCLLLYYLTNIKTHDASNNFKLYRKSMLDTFTIESTSGFEVALEITVKACLKNYKIEEIPTIWTERTSGVSNFKLFQWIPSYAWWCFLLVIKRNIMSRSFKEIF